MGVPAEGLLRQLAVRQHAPGLGADYAVDDDLDASLVLAHPGVRRGPEVAVDGDGGQIGYVPVQQSLEFAYGLPLGTLTHRGSADAVRRARARPRAPDVQVEDVLPDVAGVVHTGEDDGVGELQGPRVIGAGSGLAAGVGGQELVLGQGDRPRVVGVVLDAEQVGDEIDESRGQEPDQGGGHGGHSAPGEDGDGGGSRLGDGFRYDFLLLRHVAGVEFHQRRGHREILRGAGIERLLDGDHPQARGPEDVLPAAAVRELDHGLRIRARYQLDRAEDLVFRFLTNLAFEPGPHDLYVRHDASIPAVRAGQQDASPVGGD
ncbi:hypothetical protein QBB31_34860 [Streptomyces scabiei]